MGKPHLPLPSVGLGCIVVSYTSIFLCVRYVYELMNILVLGMYMRMLMHEHTGLYRYVYEHAHEHTGFR